MADPVAVVGKDKPEVVPVLRTCVVCGNQSHRADWINKSGDFVACDFHTKDELSRAISKPNDKAKAEVIAMHGGAPAPVRPPVAPAPSAPATQPGQPGTAPPPVFPPTK
jgi:hypothetical protein